ncbi:MAG: hypothetical protein ACRD5M_04995 [Candidatus Acidiferrales bacterium]
MKHCDEVGCPKLAEPGQSYCKDHLDEEYFFDVNDLESAETANKALTRDRKGPAISSPASDVWAESRCFHCGKMIGKGEPRCVLMFAELGIGPGHREYQEDQEYDLDEDKGLLTNSSTAIAMCRPCSCQSRTLEIENPWFTLREALAAEDPGGSVWTIPVSQLNISSADIREDHHGGDNPQEDLAAAQNDAEDRFLSTHAESPLQRPLTQDDHRGLMLKFLLTAESRRMTEETRKVCDLWAHGKKQTEIRAVTGLSQAKVSRLIRAGRDVFYSSSQKKS